MMNRRNFFKNLLLAGSALTLVSRSALSAIPDAIYQSAAKSAPPLSPSNGDNYVPVVSLNSWTLPYRFNKGVKEFHLIAEPVVRAIAPFGDERGEMKANLWGYNGQSPGPTIEVVEGDHVRIFVTNKLKENTSVHWHGQILPNGMDGVSGLTQPSIPPGKTFVYEFTAKHPGTFMYHPHADEMLQMAMGMMGFWVTHPKGRHPFIQKVDRDFCFLIASYDIDPGSYTPKTSTMTEFNLWTWNSRVFPGIDTLNVRQGDRVRIRIGNLSMTSHPIHLHGHTFTVTGTDGGAVPLTARHPEVTIDVAVGQMRQIEFIAQNQGDWAFHCHKSHHTMNPMGHTLPNMINVDQREFSRKIQKLVPDYMAMGESGMLEMEEMQMPLPENTLPMMMGEGPFGKISMGGMFTVLKVRKNKAPSDYSDSGWYQHPANTMAYEWTKGLPESHRQKK